MVRNPPPSVPVIFFLRQSSHQNMSRLSAKVFGVVIVRMEPKSGIDGESAHLAHPFQFCGVGPAWCSMSLIDGDGRQPRQLLDFTERTVELLGMGAIPRTIRPPRLPRNVLEQNI